MLIAVELTKYMQNPYNLLNAASFFNGILYWLQGNNPKGYEDGLIDHHAYMKMTDQSVRPH